MRGRASFAFDGHDGGVADDRVTCRVRSQWPAGHFAENLAVAADGSVLVSPHSESRIDRCDPLTGATSVFAHMPGPVAGLVFDRKGTLWACGGEVGQRPGFIWRIDATGDVVEWLQSPTHPF